MEYLNQIKPGTHGERIGKIARPDAHEQGILHETIHCWVIDGDGRVLLQYRAKTKSQYADCFHMAVAGHVEFGDSARDTVKKEAEEEIGLIMRDENLTQAFDMEEALIVPENGSTDNEFRTVWTYSLEPDEELGELQQSEVESVKWVPLDEFEAGINDGTLYDQMLQHDKQYYLDIISALRERLNG